MRADPEDGEAEKGQEKTTDITQTRIAACWARRLYSMLVPAALRRQSRPDPAQPYGLPAICAGVIDFASMTIASAAMAVICGILAAQGFSKPRNGVVPSIEALT